MREAYKNQIWLHFAVLIFGTTGILGKLISLGAYHLVWYRLVVAVIALGLFLLVVQHRFRSRGDSLIKMLAVGIILAAHWVSFFEAIKQSNVSVSLVCFSSSTLFVSFIEPLYYKRKVAWHEPVLGAFIVVGLSFVFRAEFTHIVGMQLSILSAFLAAWFTVLNGLLVRDNDARTITFFELLGALGALSLFMLLTDKLKVRELSLPFADLGWLLILGIVCTAFSFVLSVQLVKKISPYSFVMAVNLEPIYAILLALLIWPESETMSEGFYLGAGIVVLTIFLNGYFQKKRRPFATGSVDRGG